MANAIYPKAKEAILRGLIDLSSSTVKAVLVDTGEYTYSAAHEFLTSLPALARISTTTMGGKTVTDGVFDAADLVFTAVTGATCEALVLYKDTGTEGTSRLVAYFDSASSGLPVTPDGTDVNVVFDNGANKIFSI